MRACVVAAGASAHNTRTRTCTRARRFESVNFLEFVKLLAPFRPHVPVDEKLALLFAVFDVDGDGVCVRGLACLRWLRWLLRKHCPHSSSLASGRLSHCHPSPPPTHPTHPHVAAGLVSRDDMTVMLRQLAGSTLTDDDVAALITKGFDAAGAPQGLNAAAFKAAVAGRDLASMEITVPSDLS